MRCTQLGQQQGEIFMKIAKTQHERTLYIVQLGLFTAILIVLNFTPLGFLQLGIVKITFMAIPVVVGAVILGPVAGAFLGLVFGICSLLQAPTDPLFSIAFAKQPFIIAAICLIPRVLIGVFAAYSAKLAGKFIKYEKASYLTAGLVGSLTNTVLFLGGVILFLEKIITPKMAESGYLTAKTFIGFWVGIGVVNGIPEAIACTILSAAIIIPLKKLNAKSLH
jgi:uncharacterized membrane protein